MTRTTRAKVEIPLTRPELDVKAHDMAAAQVEMDGLRKELKEVSADYRKQIKELDGRINLLARHIDTGHEERVEECDMVGDFENHRMLLIWNGLVVRVRPIAPGESQRGLTDDIREAQPNEVVLADDWMQRQEQED